VGTLSRSESVAIGLSVLILLVLAFVGMSCIQGSHSETLGYYEYALLGHEASDAEREMLSLRGKAVSLRHASSDAYSKSLENQEESANENR